MRRIVAWSWLETDFHRYIFISLWGSVILIAFLGEQWAGPKFDSGSDSGSRVTDESFFKGVDYYVQKDNRLR